MKRLIFILLAIALMAAPVAAGTVIFNFTEMDPSVTQVQFYYGPNDNTVATADEFLLREDLTATEMLPVTGPMEFDVEFADGVEFAIYGRIFDALGNNDYIKDNGSPSVWWDIYDAQLPANYIRINGQQFIEPGVNVNIYHYEAPK